MTLLIVVLAICLAVAGENSMAVIYVALAVLSLDDGR